MIDTILGRRILNETLLKVADDLTPLYEFEEAPKVAPYRLQENLYAITEERQERLCGVITAHNLEQYGNKFYSIALREDVYTWLDWLLEVDYVNSLYDN